MSLALYIARKSPDGATLQASDAVWQALADRLGRQDRRLAEQLRQLTAAADGTQARLSVDAATADKLLALARSNK